MLTEKNFPAALKAMNFTERGNFFEKVFAENVTMSVDFKAKKLFYPAQIKGRDRNNFFDENQRENLVVFECVNRLLDKGYRPEDIELERQWQLGHSPKGGRADICVFSDAKVLFIVECKTFGDEFNHELDNMLADGGQLFSYWQQEQSCQWLMLYASNFRDDKLIFNAKCVSCEPKFYGEAYTVPERFKIWSERFEKFFFDDVIFHAETVAYKIGVKPLRKRDLKDFSELKSVVNNFEEILRHNPVSNKANAFDVLIALFICKLADESQTADDGEVSFQFKYGIDSQEIFQDRLQKLYSEGMEKFLKEKIEYVPLSRVDDLLRQLGKITREELIAVFKDDYRRMKFFSPNVFAFINVYNEKLFYMNGRVLFEVVHMLHEYKIIGSKDLQTLGDLFEQLLNKGFKQDEGQFFTPVPIARFIWDSLLLDEIILRDGQAEPPKVIDYACGAGHFLTEGFKAINDCFTRNNLPPPVMWERDKLFGIEKDPRLATVSKISLFMHGANEGKIKFGDGLENYPDENIAPETFDVLVANPPYSVKGFKKYIRLANENFFVFDKISNDGSEIETLFVERISQLVKPRGVAAVILPSSILNKEGKSFIAARESLLKNFYVRAIVQLGSKTFGATGTNTVILFLQRIFDPPERARLLKDSAKIILHDAIQIGDEEEEIFAAYTKKIGMSSYDYKKFIAEADEKTIKLEREKIIFFGLTYRQTTLIISAPADNKEQEIFLGYGWSNAKGREGIVDKKRGGLLFDNDNRAAENTLAAVIRAAFNGERIQNPALEKYFRYSTLADLLDFEAADFTKKISIGSDYAPAEYNGNFPLVKLGEHIRQIRGVSYKPNDLHLELDDDSYILLRANNISDGKINHDKLQFVSREKVSDAQIIRNGDILMSASSGSLEHVGKVALCTESVAGETFGAFCKVIRSTGELMPEYIAIYLSTPDCRKIIANVAKGANINNLRNEHIDNLKIPLPPLDVQKKIVAEFNALDAQIDSTDETIQSLDADIQAKFAALFVDKNFPVKKLGDVCEINAETFDPTKTPEKIFHYVDISSVDSATNEINFSNTVTGAAAPSRARRLASNGDVLISTVRPNLKSFAQIVDAPQDTLYSTGFAVLSKKQPAVVTNEFIFRLFMDDPLLMAQMTAKMSKGSYPSINQNDLTNFKIPVPPLELQEKFAAYVTNCEATKKSARARRDELIQARADLVTKYFR